MMFFMGSPWLLDQDNAGLILHVLQHCGFVDKVNVLDWPTYSPDLSPIENVWPVMKRIIRQRGSQTAAEHLNSCFKRDWTKM